MAKAPTPKRSPLVDAKGRSISDYGRDERIPALRTKEEWAKERAPKPAPKAKPEDSGVGKVVAGAMKASPFAIKPKRAGYNEGGEVKKPAPKPAPKPKPDLTVPTAIKNIRSGRSKIEEAEAKALGMNKGGMVKGKKC